MREDDLQLELQGKMARLQIASELVNGLANILQEAAGDNAKYANFIKGVNEVQIIANGALAIAEALVTANAPTADNVASGGLAGLIKFATISGVILSTIAQSIANLKTTNIPQFAEGVIGFKGKGTETSDSNPVLISTNESIITAKRTRQYPDELQSIQDGTFDNLIYGKYIKPSENAIAENIMRNLSLQAELNDENIVKYQRFGNLIAMKNHRELISNLTRKQKIR